MRLGLATRASRFRSSWLACPAGDRKVKLYAPGRRLGLATRSSRFRSSWLSPKSQVPRPGSTIRIGDSDMQLGFAARIDDALRGAPPAGERPRTHRRGRAAHSARAARPGLAARIDDPSRRHCLTTRNDDSDHDSDWRLRSATSAAQLGTGAQPQAPAWAGGPAGRAGCLAGGPAGRTRGLGRRARGPGTCRRVSIRVCSSFDLFVCVCKKVCV